MTHFQVRAISFINKTSMTFFNHTQLKTYKPPFIFLNYICMPQIKLIYQLLFDI